MKKHLFLSVIFVFLFVGTVRNLSASECSEKVRETVMENGLTVFTLEDYSTPLVRVEVCIRAGFSSQTAYNAGFFNLLSRMVQKTSRVNFNEVRCNSDSTRFILNVSPSVLEDTLAYLSEDIFNPVFSDSLLSSELALMKREVLQLNSDLGNLINSSIDTRVFEEEPWRHESGVYPALFSKVTEDIARTILNDILEKYYTPQNAAIFVSGNFHEKKVLDSVSKFWGVYYSNRKSNFKMINFSRSGQKKFVLHHKDFSSDLSQIVVQYASFDADVSELAAAVYNDDKSALKNRLAENKTLNIPGNEYINIASAYKTGCSRLIVQSLFQNVKNVSPATQVLEFVSVLNDERKISQEDFTKALLRRESAYRKITDTSASFMETLSEFWAIKPYYNAVMNQNSSVFNSPTAYEMQARNDSFVTISPETVEESFFEQDPFIFLIISTAQYNKYKKELTQAGYAEINSKNSSWYTQSLYKNLKTMKDLQLLSQGEKKDTKSESWNFTEDFYKSSKESITCTELKNKIPLIIKENPASSNVSFILSISGGNLNTSQNHGFEEVMTNILALKIMRRIEYLKESGAVTGGYEIKSETLLDSSRIILEMDSEDFLPVMSAVISAIVLSDILPSDADRIVQGRKTRKRLENGSMINQLFSAAINFTMSASPYANIYETDKEILTDTTYEDILAGYPLMLDASRFSLIVCGNIEHNFAAENLDKLFSILQNQAERERKVYPNNFDFPKGRQQKVKVIHTFLTDVSADKAGPMPSVLVPTKTFSDPALFCIKAPEYGTEEYFIFNSILPYLQKSMNEYASEKKEMYNCSVSFASASKNIPMATISFSAVDRTSYADSLMKNSVKNLKSNLSSSGTCVKTLREIKDAWVFNEFEWANTNTGNALLIDKSLYESEEVNGSFYLEKYKFVNELTAEKILSVIEQFYDFDNMYRLYSADSKK
ncbi:MAG: insulinase family protein [Treponema sp.]|nr:insulinase family protein [Treponema sp.]